jgi:membrane-bound metal-dependent hydrolase YbcI (DUF457 family)
MSVASYAAANVAVDIEPLVHFVRGEWPLHGWAHTFAGAGAIGVVTGFACAFAMRRFAQPSRAAVFRGELEPGPIVIGGALGGLTHPLLDGLMHADVRPFLPFTAANPLLHLVPVGDLMISCAVMGLIGGIVLLSRRSTWRPPA